MSAIESASAAPVERAPEFSRRRLMYALALLLGVGTFNIIDRTIINLLLVPIGEELQLTDWQLGAYAGLAFALFYALAQIPIARFADVGQRGTVIALALAFWSAMTAMQGLALGFFTLALARAGVAIGEAGSGPASQSVIADLFSPRQRTRAFAIFAMQAPIGVAIGSLIGGFGRQWLGWRETLFLVGIPGLLFAFAVWKTLPDPTRGYWQPRKIEATASTRETFAFLLGLPALRHLVIGYSITVIVAGAQSFDPVYLERSFGLTPAQIGSLIGASGMLSMIGYYFGGWLSDRYSVRNPAWAMRLPAIFLLLHLCLASVYYFAPQPSIAIAVALIGPFFPATLPLVFANAQNLAPAHMRARAGALWLTASTLVGMGIGPLLAGALSDALTPTFGRESIRYALIGIVAVGYLWAAVHYLLGSRSLERDLAAKDVYA